MLKAIRNRKCCEKVEENFCEISRHLGAFGSATIHQVATVIKTNSTEVLILDSRSFLEYNTCHLTNAININCSKLIKRRLQQDKVSVKDLIQQNGRVDCVDATADVVIYDENTTDPKSIPDDSFLAVIITKLREAFRSVSVLKGGFLEFSTKYPELCEDKNSKNHAPLTTHSGPCLPVTNCGPTKILPFLYLGSSKDAQDNELMKMLGITYILNATGNMPRAECVPQDGQFLRIPVQDNYAEKLLPWFELAFSFIDKVKNSGESVLIHCMAGISRSPTFVIGYIMRNLHMTSDEAYRYVKAKRPVISPNFNFLGQLLEWEQVLLSKGYSLGSGTPSFKRQCVFNVSTTTESIVTTGLSPTSAIAKLTFVTPSNSKENLLSPGSNKVSAIPTKNLDKLNFTPCVASDISEESDDIVPVVKISCHSDENSVCSVKVRCELDSSDSSRVHEMRKSNSADLLDVLDKYVVVPEADSVPTDRRELIKCSSYSTGMSEVGKNSAKVPMDFKPQFIRSVKLDSSRSPLLKYIKSATEAFKRDMKSDAGKPPVPGTKRARFPFYKSKTRAPPEVIEADRDFLISEKDAAPVTPTGDTFRPVFCAKKKSNCSTEQPGCDKSSVSVTANDKKSKSTFFCKSGPDSSTISAPYKRNFWDSCSQEVKPSDSYQSMQENQEKVPKVVSCEDVEGEWVVTAVRCTGKPDVPACVTCRNVTCAPPSPNLKCDSDVMLGETRSLSGSTTVIRRQHRYVTCWRSTDNIDVDSEQPILQKPRSRDSGSEHMDDEQTKLTPREVDTALLQKSPAIEIPSLSVHRALNSQDSGLGHSPARSDCDPDSFDSVFKDDGKRAQIILKQDDEEQLDSGCFSMEEDGTVIRQAEMGCLVTEVKPPVSLTTTFCRYVKPS